MFAFRPTFGCTATLLLCCAVSLGAQSTKQTVGEAVPGRFLVLYRNAIIPETAEAAVTAIGLHVAARHQSLGILVVDTNLIPGAESRSRMHPEVAQFTSRSLALQPGVEAVLQDRIVTAHQLTTRTIPNNNAFPVSPSNPGAGPAAAPPADTFYTISPQDWAVKQVGGYGKGVPGGPATGPWDVTTGTGIRIAILDSGVDAQHPDIAPNLALNLSEVDQTALPSACDDGSPQDQSGHGTWTASLAAAAMGPGTGLMIGVAPSATLLNIKVLQRMPSTAAADGLTSTQLCAAGEAGGLLSWVIKGIEDAVANHADIISLSLGTIVDTYTGDGAGLKTVFDQVTHAAANAGVILVASAGNDGRDLSTGQYIELPAQARDVLAIVASTNPACHQDLTTANACSPGPSTLAYYSNFGAPLDALAAPGGSYPAGADFDVSGWVRGACSGGLSGTDSGLPADKAHSFGCFNLGHTQYVQAIGTSASAPLAAGVAALFRAAHPAWSAAAVVNAMRASAVATEGLPNPQVTAASIHP